MAIQLMSFWKNTWKVLPTRREELIMQIVARRQMSGREIRDECERRGRAFPLGSLYTTLSRMETKGFIKSKTGEPNPERGGNKRRLVRITSEGRFALRLLQEKL